MEFQNQYQKVVPFILFVLALLLLFKLVQPLITVLLGSVLLAYISFPLYTKIHRKLASKFLSIILALLIVFIIILIPFAFITIEVTHQGYILYNSISSESSVGPLFGIGCVSADSKICLLLNQLERFSSGQLSAFGFDKQLKLFLPYIGEKIIAFILSIPLMLVKLFLAFIIAYFILKDWQNLLKQIVDVIPLREKTVERMISEFGNISHTVIYAQLFVAFVQGVIGAIGFFIFGVPFPIVLGVILAFCALIPNIGTAIIWVPISLFMILTGYASHNYWLLGKGIGLFFYGLLIVSMIDNFLLAKIVRVKAHVNQIVVIIGVIGGASMFGFVGIFIGPILLPLLLTYFETFKERFV